MIFANMQLLRRGFAFRRPHGRAPLVTFSQIGILFMLKDKKQLRNTEIAKQLGISPSAATQLLAGLETHGFIDRVQAPSDRRAAFLSLSAKGSHHIEQLRRRQVDEVYQIFSVLNGVEIEQ